MSVSPFCGSVKFWYGSGSADSDPDPRIQIQFFASYCLKLYLHHFSKIKKSQNRRNQGFSYYFGLMVRIREAQQKTYSSRPTTLVSPMKTNRNLVSVTGDLCSEGWKFFFLNCFIRYYFLNVHLHIYSKIKSQKEVKKQ